MARVAWLVIAVLIVAACGADASVPTAQTTSVGTAAPPAASTVPETTTSSTSTSTTAVPTTTTTIPAAMTPLSAAVRLEGDTGLVGVTVLLCNTSGGTTDPEDVTIGVGDGVGQAAVDGVAPNLCRVASVPDLPVDPSTTSSVEVTLLGTTTTLQVTPVGASLVASDAELAAYGECRTINLHRDCVSAIGPHPAPGEGEIVLAAGDGRVIGPAAYEDLAMYSLMDDDVCIARVEQYLGAAAPRPIVYRHVITDLSLLITSPGRYMANLGPVEEFEDFRELLDIRGWAELLDGVCGNGHESTHAVHGYTAMPYAVAEGLAIYVDHKVRKPDGSGYYWRCGPDGFATSSAGPVTPYDSISDPQTEGGWTDSAICFWDWIESQYGSDGFRAVIAALVAGSQPGFAGCGVNRPDVSFISDVVEPALGTSVEEVTAARWGLTGDYSGC